MEKEKLLELVMIVKNSGNVLRKCLQSFIGVIDHWTILDTGSTDNTPQIILEELKSVEGNLYYSDFVDFSHARNLAFEKSKKNCKYQIVIDDSYVLHGGKFLCSILKKSKKDAMQLRIGFLNDLEILDNSYYSLRIVRSNINAKFVGRIHEAIYLEMKYISDIIKNKDIFLEDVPDKDHVRRITTRFKKDVDLLLQDYDDAIIKRDPNSSRIILHIAKTYMCLNNYKDAIVYLKKLASDAKCSEYLFFAKNQLYTIEFSEYECSDLYNNRDKMITLMMDLFVKFPARQGETGFTVASLLNEKNTEIEKLSVLMDNLIQQPKPDLLLTEFKSIVYYYYIPYLYVEVKLKMKQFNKAVTVLKNLLEKFPTHQPLLNIKYALSEHDLTETIHMNQKVMVIHMGSFFYTWNPLDNLAISGSEFMAINMAKEFTKKGFRVFLFGSFEGKDEFGKQVNYECTQDVEHGKIIQFLDKTKYSDFCSQYYVEYLIVSRDINNLLYYDNISNVYLWVHDILPINRDLPMQIHPKKFKGVITVSKWQKNNIKEKMGLDEHYMILSSNAIYVERFFNPKIVKKPYQIIYLSDPSRGLENLVPLVKRLKEDFPQITLKIFSKKEMIDKNTLKEIEDSDYMFLNGRVDQSRIAIELLESDLFIYPTDWSETFCISALEAMAAKCLVFTVALAGLKNLCEDNRGILVPYPYNQEEMYKKICFVLRNSLLKENYINNGYKFAMNMTFENLVKDWMVMFEERK